MATPLVRVVSKNLFLSAQEALAEPSARGRNVTVSNLRDLCTLITLAMLYDEVETLGSKKELDPGYKQEIAEGYESIHDLTGLEIKVGPSPSEFDKTLDRSTALASAPFLAAGVKNVQLDELKQKLRYALRLGTSDVPDRWKDYLEGQTLALGTTNWGEGSGPEKYWLRSFLYTGLAAKRGCAFVPDAIRSWGMTDVPAAPSNYGSDLENAIEGKYPPPLLRKLIINSKVDVPPFAAAVFVRAQRDGRNIRAVVRELREEMLPVRQALAGFHWEHGTADYRGFLTLFGKARSADADLAVDNRQRDAIGALRSMKFPVPPQCMVLKPAFDVVSSATSFVSKLASNSPKKSIEIGTELIKTILGLGDVKEVNDSGGFLEVHYRLGWTLREWFNEGIKLEDLFGEIDDDEPKKTGSATQGEL